MEHGVTESGFNFCCQNISLMAFVRKRLLEKGNISIIYSLILNHISLFITVRQKK